MILKCWVRGVAGSHVRQTLVGWLAGRLVGCLPADYHPHKHKAQRSTLVAVVSLCWVRCVARTGAVPWSSCV